MLFRSHGHLHGLSAGSLLASPRASVRGYTHTSLHGHNHSQQSQSNSQLLSGTAKKDTPALVSMTPPTGEEAAGAPETAAVADLAAAAGEAFAASLARARTVLLAVARAARLPQEELAAMESESKSQDATLVAAAAAAAAAAATTEALRDGEAGLAHVKQLRMDDCSDSDNFEDNSNAKRKTLQTRSTNGNDGDDNDDASDGETFALDDRGFYKLKRARTRLSISTASSTAFVLASPGATALQQNILQPLRRRPASLRASFAALADPSLLCTATSQTQWPWQSQSALWLPSPLRSVSAVSTAFGAFHSTPASDSNVAFSSAGGVFPSAMWASVPPAAALCAFLAFPAPSSYAPLAHTLRVVAATAAAAVATSISAAGTNAGAAAVAAAAATEAGFLELSIDSNHNLSHNSNSNNGPGPSNNASSTVMTQARALAREPMAVCSLARAAADAGLAAALPASLHTHVAKLLWGGNFNNGSHSRECGFDCGGASVGAILCQLYALANLGVDGDNTNISPASTLSTDRAVAFLSRGLAPHSPATTRTHSKRQQRLQQERDAVAAALTAASAPTAAGARALAALVEASLAAALAPAAAAIVPAATSTTYSASSNNSGAPRCDAACIACNAEYIPSPVSALAQVLALALVRVAALGCQFSSSGAIAAAAAVDTQPNSSGASANGQSPRNDAGGNALEAIARARALALSTLRLLLLLLSVDPALRAGLRAQATAHEARRELSNNTDCSRDTTADADGGPATLNGERMSSASPDVRADFVAPTLVSAVLSLWQAAADDYPVAALCAAVLTVALHWQCAPASVTAATAAAFTDISGSSGSNGNDGAVMSLSQDERYIVNCALTRSRTLPTLQAQSQHAQLAIVASEVVAADETAAACARAVVGCTRALHPLLVTTTPSDTGYITGDVCGATEQYSQSWSLLSELASGTNAFSPPHSKEHHSNSSNRGSSGVNCPLLLSSPVGLPAPPLLLRHGVLHSTYHPEALLAVTALASALTLTPPAPQLAVTATTQRGVSAGTLHALAVSGANVHTPSIKAAAADSAIAAATESPAARYLFSLLRPLPLPALAPLLPLAPVTTAAVPGAVSAVPAQTSAGLSVLPLPAQAHTLPLWALPRLRALLRLIPSLLTAARTSGARTNPNADDITVSADAEAGLIALARLCQLLLRELRALAPAPAPTALAVGLLTGVFDCPSQSQSQPLATEPAAANAAAEVAISAALSTAGATPAAPAHVALAAAFTVAARAGANARRLAAVLGSARAALALAAAPALTVAAQAAAHAGTRFAAGIAHGLLALKAAAFALPAAAARAHEARVEAEATGAPCDRAENEPDSESESGNSKNDNNSGDEVGDQRGRSRSRGDNTRSHRDRAIVYDFDDDGGSSSTNTSRWRSLPDRSAHLYSAQLQLAAASSASAAALTRQHQAAAAAASAAGAPPPPRPVFSLDVLLRPTQQHALGAANTTAGADRNSDGSRLASETGGAMSNRPARGNGPRYLSTCVFDSVLALAKAPGPDAAVLVAVVSALRLAATLAPMRTARSLSQLQPVSATNAGLGGAGAGFVWRSALVTPDTVASAATAVAGAGSANSLTSVLSVPMSAFPSDTAAAVAVATTLPLDPPQPAPLSQQQQQQKQQYSRSRSSGPSSASRPQSAPLYWPCALPRRSAAVAAAAA